MTTRQLDLPTKIMWSYLKLIQKRVKHPFDAAKILMILHDITMLTYSCLADMFTIVTVIGQMKS